MKNVFATMLPWRRILLRSFALSRYTLMGRHMTMEEITGLVDGKGLAEMISLNLKLTAAWPCLVDNTSAEGPTMSVSPLVSWALMDSIATSLHMPTLTSPTHSAAPYRPIWTSLCKVVYNPLKSFPGDHQGSRISRPLARHHFSRKSLPPTAR